MRINVILSPANYEELYFTGKTTVAVDVLRASSTIVTALMNGAKEIIPVGSVEFAMKASSSMFGGQTLLGGERNTKKIDGFNLGNSPFEYSREMIEGKAIILFTTNGSRAIVRAKFSDHLFIGSFLNLEAIAKHLIQHDNSFEILCAGRNNAFSLEDTVFAGKLITEIMNLKEDVELSDSARAAVSLAKSLGKNLKKMMLESEHGKILVENGFAEDVAYCSKLNSTDVVPCFNSGTIRVLDNSKNENADDGQHNNGT